MTRILTPWNWSTNPAAPLCWPDPERRVVLVEPDLWEGPIGEGNVRAAARIAALERRGAIVVEPTRDPGRMASPTSIPLLPGIMPPLLARTQAEVDAGLQAEVDAGLPDLLAVPASHRALLLEPREAIGLSVDLASTRPRGALGCWRCNGYGEGLCTDCDGSGLAIDWVLN